MSPVSTSLHLTCLLKMDPRSSAGCAISDVFLKHILGSSDFVETLKNKKAVPSPYREVFKLNLYWSNFFRSFQVFRFSEVDSGFMHHRGVHQYSDQTWIRHFYRDPFLINIVHTIGSSLFYVRNIHFPECELRHLYVFLSSFVCFSALHLFFCVLKYIRNKIFTVSLLCFVSWHSRCCHIRVISCKV